MVSFSAPGKAIILGEHTSLYGNPAIAFSLEERVFVSVEKSETKLIRSSDKVLPNEAIAKFGGMWKIDISSQIPVGIGLGSSAAVSVALCAAMGTESQLFAECTKSGRCLQESDTRVLQKMAQNLESKVHGKSSGLDTFTSIMGGVIEYQNGGGEKISLKEMPKFMVAYGKSQKSSKEQIARVERIRVDNPQAFKDFLSESESIVKKGRRALESGDLNTLGEAMDANHDLLLNMGLSGKELDRMVLTARENGALGAKVCGAGTGGAILVLTPESAESDIKKALKGLGTKIKDVKIGQIGARVELSPPNPK